MRKIIDAEILREILLERELDLIQGIKIDREFIILGNCVEEI